VLTLGVDLAAADVRTAVAAVQWSEAHATVQDLQLGVSDDQLIEAIQAADKAGLDCPLGWPEKFVSFVVAQQSGALPPVDSDNALWRRQLAYRLTDEVVRAETGLVPLSVSADRIAHAAFRCASLLARLAAEGQPVDRCGDGLVVEVYPAAALFRWRLSHRGYKTPGRGVGHDFLVDELTTAAPWLRLGYFEQLCRDSHDAFDAVLAAMAARAAAMGQVLMPDTAQRERARTEGWIALPTCTLDDLIRR